jgi:hypothetical protein
MDYHTSIVLIYPRDDQPGLLARAAGILTRAGMRVTHDRVGFHPHLPEISPPNALFSSIKSSIQHQKLFEGEAVAFHPAVAPEGNDIVIKKHRVNAFVGPISR